MVFSGRSVGWAIVGLGLFALGVGGLLGLACVLSCMLFVAHVYISRLPEPQPECTQGGGGGGEAGAGPGNMEVIVVRVCQPVFRHLPHSYTWPLEKKKQKKKKQTHSST